MLSTIKTLPGIDALYYFAETNENYDLFYIDILDQIETQTANYTQDIRYRYGDITAEIDGHTFIYTGNAEGFLWLEDKHKFYRIGLKDKYKNTTLHNIRIQLSAVGIYLLGVRSLLELINTQLLKEVTTGVFPITRLDLNLFVQHDLSTISKEAFVSKKRKYTEYLRAIGNAHALETLYVGKKPFKLRLYNKRLEMKQSDKEGLMQEYFLNHDFQLNRPIFNVEFEMHRAYLRYYEINTVEDALERSEQLFKQAMDSIRYADLSTISQTDLESGNKYRAATHPLWEHLRDSYTLDEFLQTTAPLKRIKRIQEKYTLRKAVKEHYELGRKAKLLGIDYNAEFLSYILGLVEESFDGKDIKIDDSEMIVEVDVDESRKELYTITKQKNLTTMDDDELIKHYENVTSELETSRPELRQTMENKVTLALYEMERRELIAVPL